MDRIFHIHPIGIIHKQEDKTWIDIEAQFREGLLGLNEFSHIIVLYWFDRSDTPQDRGILQVHPKKNSANPLTGVFATHAPVRPNPIALTVCKLVAIENLRLHLDTIDALDGSPVVDIKCHIPCRRPEDAVRIPAWVTHGN
jgi:tRNA (adenine37-N6)-methyltransferase